MATFDITLTTYGSATFAGRVAAYFGNLSAALIAWNDARVTRNALNTLTDRELEDIGLIRGDIEAVVSGR
ncbi:MAG: DUF1127 domain-containing protein [Pseudomonadota bacterium]